MQPADFLRTTRVVIVAGKGGVGKTTVTAALARLAASEGLDTLVIEVEGKSGLAALFGRPPLGYEESILHPRAGAEGEVRGRTLTPDDALLEYLDDHGMRRVSKRLVSTGALDVVSTAAPGIKDILILGKVKQLEAKGVADLIILDAPAAGHAITFLLAARALLDSVKVGPINTQAQEVVGLLGDPSRSSVVLVALPEETPVNELVETAFHLEDRVGVSLGPVVVNGLYPHLDGLDVDPAQAAADAGTTLRDGEGDALKAAAEFRRRRTTLQEEQLGRLSELLPLPQLRLPFLFKSDLGTDDLELLAGELRACVEALP